MKIKDRAMLCLALIYVIMAGGIGAVVFWHNPVTLVAVLALVFTAIPGLVYLMIREIER